MVRACVWGRSWDAYEAPETEAGGATPSLAGTELRRVLAGGVLLQSLGFDFHFWGVEWPPLCSMECNARGPHGELQCPPLSVAANSAAGGGVGPAPGLRSEPHRAQAGGSPDTGDTGRPGASSTGCARLGGAHV